MTNTNDSSNSLTSNLAERIEVLDPSQYSLQVVVDENGDEKINLSIHCSPEQAAKGPLRIFKDVSGNYGVGFLCLAQARPKSCYSQDKSLELYKKVLETMED